MSRLFACCAAAILAAGCAGSRPPQFYALDPGASPVKHMTPAFTVAVGPVSVPDSVDRPQLVLRVGVNEVAIAEQARWAEPLKSSIPRVIANRLELELETARVGIHGKSAPAEADYRVRVDIERFDSRFGDGVVIEAVWHVARANGGPRWIGRSVVRQAAGKDYDSLVSAHSNALASVGRDIAQAIRLVQ
jgi:uncharacterized lipoprotein YmbA